MATIADRAVDRLLDDAGGPPRADARRNLYRLVEAAQRAVDDIGIGVTAHDIAAAAGVGVGTFYRRVASREVLLEAILVETVEDILAAARAAVDDPEPWQGFRSFATSYVRLRVASCGLTAALGAAAPAVLESRLRTLRALLRKAVDRAQRAGVVRADVTWQDVAFLLASVAPDQHTIGLRARVGQWRRTLDVLLDGLAPARGAD